MRLQVERERRRVNTGLARLREGTTNGRNGG